MATKGKQIPTMTPQRVMDAVHAAAASIDARMKYAMHEMYPKGAIDEHAERSLSNRDEGIVARTNSPADIAAVDTIIGMTKPPIISLFCRHCCKGTTLGE